MKKRVFQKDLVYVFSFKKFKQQARRKKLKVSGWEKELNGRKVLINENPFIGLLQGGYSVSINWCKCIGRM